MRFAAAFLIASGSEDPGVDQKAEAEAPVPHRAHSETNGHRLVVCLPGSLQVASQNLARLRLSTPTDEYIDPGENLA
jgi:hypothetical protein